jgi:hypothetical protein
MFALSNIDEKHGAASDRPGVDHGRQVRVVADLLRRSRYVRIERRFNGECQ